MSMVKFTPKSVMYLLSPERSALFFALACGWYYPDYDFTQIRVRYKDYFIFYVRSGQVSFEILGQKHIVNAGQAFACDLSNEYSQMPVKGTDCEMMWCHFSGNESEQLISIINERQMVVDIAQNSPFIAHFEKMLALAHIRPPSMEFEISACIHVLLSEMIASVLRETSDEQISQKHSHINSYIDTYIEEHYREKITISALAEGAYLSPFHFSRIFKQLKGQTVAQYVLHYKIEKSKLLIRYSQKPLKRIAEDLGFSDLSHYWKTFKRVVGVTPAYYRTAKDTVGSDRDSE